LHDVASRAIGERMEEAVDLGVAQLSYNHMVVGYSMSFGASM
jgi:hypothetical protein